MPHGKSRGALATANGQVTQAVFILPTCCGSSSRTSSRNTLRQSSSRAKKLSSRDLQRLQANRQQMPDDLASQMPYIKRLCEVYNVPMISVRDSKPMMSLARWHRRQPTRAYSQSSFPTTRTCASWCAIL